MDLIIYSLWKLKMNVVLVKNGCAIAIECKENKPKGMFDDDFNEKDKLAMANLLLALDE